MKFHGVIIEERSVTHTVDADTRSDAVRQLKAIADIQGDYFDPATVEAVVAPE